MANGKCAIKVLTDLIAQASFLYSCDNCDCCFSPAPVSHVFLRVLLAVKYLHTLVFNVSLNLSTTDTFRTLTVVQ